MVQFLLTQSGVRTTSARCLFCHCFVFKKSSKGSRKILLGHSYWQSNLKILFSTMVHEQFNLDLASLFKILNQKKKVPTPFFRFYFNSQSKQKGSHAVLPFFFIIPFNNSQVPRFFIKSSYQRITARHNFKFGVSRSQRHRIPQNSDEHPR